MAFEKKYKMCGTAVTLRSKRTRPKGLWQSEAFDGSGRLLGHGLDRERKRAENAARLRAVNVIRFPEAPRG